MKCKCGKEMKQQGATSYCEDCDKYDGDKK